ncbi:uncharacterized protein BX663DRAFT_58776 [Cokeromyces recurvatus]|uniref:uncharacterized protein n=1 Tax=Cokeromyces recurvatus TaxID=90255 RepID=UPI00221F474F|nr:uncharacterized protein BX663DRAFT_58776 [Cokeromyces recurvatus]KAI7903033.1 hypothetical protein BX663DRAFT_58776 [Cokeromyces recurvatus]
MYVLNVYKIKEWSLIMDSTPIHKLVKIQALISYCGYNSKYLIIYSPFPKPN